MPRIWNVLQQRAERRRIRKQYEQMLLDQKEYPPPCNNNNNNNAIYTVDDETEFTVQFIKPQQQQQQIGKLDRAMKSENDSAVHSMEVKNSTLPLSQSHGQNRRLEDERKVIDDADLAYNDEWSHQENNNPVVRNILYDLCHTEVGINSIISYDDEIEGNTNIIADTTLVSEKDDVKVCAIVSPRAVVDEIFDGILEEDDRIDNGKESNTMGSSDNSNECLKTLNTSLETLHPISDLSEDENKDEGDDVQIDGLIDSFRCIHQHHLHQNNNCFRDLQIDTIESVTYEEEGEDGSDDDGDELDGPDSLHSIQQHHRTHNRFRDLQRREIRTTIYEHTKFIPSLLGTVESVSYEEDDSHEEEGNSFPQDNSELYDCDVGEEYSPDTALDNQARRSHDREEEEEEEEICFEEFRSEHVTTDDEQMQSEQYQRTTIFEHTQSDFWRSIKKEEIRCGPPQVTHQNSSMYQDTATATCNDTYDDTIDGTVSEYCSDDDNLYDVENKNDDDKQPFARLLRSFRDMNVGNQISDTDTRSSGDKVEAYDGTRGSTRSLYTMFERLGDFGIDILNETIEHAERLNTYPSPPRQRSTSTNQGDTIINTLADLFSC